MKYDRRTSRGSAFNDQGSDINQGILANVKACSLCKNAPGNHQVLKCMNCKEKFHSCCVLKPVTSEILSALYSNPSLWWFCLGCLTAMEKETQSVEHISNIEDLKTMMEEIKNSIIQDVKTMIDDKLQSPKEAAINIIHNSNQEVLNSFSSVVTHKTTENTTTTESEIKESHVLLLKVRENVTIQRKKLDM